MDIVEKMRSLESDHDPDGWPAVTMGQVSALCDEIDRLRAQLKVVQEQEPDYWKIGGLGGDVITNKKSELDLAERFNWPVEPLYKRPQPAPAAAIPKGLVDALEQSQYQIDADGTFIGVSRQALEEAINILKSLSASPKPEQKSILFN